MKTPPNPPVTPAEEERLNILIGLYRNSMLLTKARRTDEGIESLTDEEFKAALQAHIATKCLEARKEAEFMHLSDLARAVGLLEGLGHPDDILNKRYEKGLAALRAQKEGKR